MTVRVLAAGSNAHGQLANTTLDDSHTLQACVFASEDDSFRHHLPGGKVVSIASGANHTLLLLECISNDNGRQLQLWGCGDSRHGQLGPGFLEDAKNQSKPPAFRRIDHHILDATKVEQGAYVIDAIAAAWESSYVVLRSPRESPQIRKDIILSMGNDDFHDLGINPSSRLKTHLSQGPHRVALEAAFGAYAVSGFQVMAIAAGPHQVVTIIRLFHDREENVVVVGWGACRHGQLGTVLKSTAKNQVTTSPRIIPLARTDIDVNDAVVSLALGNYHTVLLHHSGRVTGFGSNRKGQLAGLRSEFEAKSVHCTWNGTYIVLQKHSESQELEIQATGSQDKGQLGRVPVSTLGDTPQVIKFPFNHTTHRLVDIACGSEHVLALFAVFGEDCVVDGATEVWGWGWNEHGNLGLGHTIDAYTPTKIWPRGGQAKKRILRVWAGCGTSWIVEAE